MTQEAMAYLNQALDLIQECFVRREHVDWTTFRQKVCALATQAHTPSETYPAIERALELLGDHHSHFRDPANVQLILDEGMLQSVGLRAIYPEGTIGLVLPSGPAQEAGLQVGDRIETVNGQPITQLSLRQFQKAFKEKQLNLTVIPAGKGPARAVSLQETPCTFWSPRGWRLEHDIGYLELPAHAGDPKHQGKAYAQEVQQIIREIDRKATCGWVIDLRRNIGGGFWQMLAGVGPILGEGACVSFVGPSELSAGFYREGQAYAEPGEYGEPREVIVEVDEAYELKRPWPPVAVLTSQLTTSAGEFVTLSFRGRPRTRSFGEPTCGIPTGPDHKVLSDGAFLLITSCLGADRTGQTYDSQLIPDQQIKVNWTQLGTTNDPVLQAALQWLHNEEGCLK